MNASIAKKIKLWKSKSLGDKIFLIIIYTIILLITFACAYPLYFTVIASFSDGNLVYRGETFLLPKGLNLLAYSRVFENKDVWLGYANTTFYTFFGTLLNLFLTIPSAYALSRPNLYGKSIVVKFLMISMYFGGGMIPTYIQLSKMGLLNTRLLLVIIGGVSVYNVIVTRTFFQNNIHESLLEAARIDGAGETYIFTRIVLPLSGAIIAVMTLYYAVGHWNSYFAAMIYTRNTDLQPLQLVLRRVLITSNIDLESIADLPEDAIRAETERAYAALTMKFALVFISSLPMLIIYPFVQKHFVKGVMIGSVKG